MPPTKKIKLLLGAPAGAATHQTTTATNTASSSPVHEMSALLKLPPEIKKRIWIYAVYVDELLAPRQIAPRSNKFVWSLHQKRSSGRVKVSAVPPLTVSQLSQVCRKVYDEVVNTNLFYQVNGFHLRIDNVWPSKPMNPDNYLMAITPARMEAIRTMTFEINYHNRNHQIFSVLNACQGLQNLTLRLSRDSLPNRTFYITNLPGAQELAMAVRGLKSLRIQVFSRSSATIDDIHVPQLNQEMKQPRTMTASSLAKFRKAQAAAALDVHGEGRLSEDRQPNIVASRTRQQTNAILGADGTVVQREVPRYDATGVLAWPIARILESRPSIFKDGTESVEFQVKCDPTTNGLQPGYKTYTIIWQDLATLNTRATNTQSSLLSFYSLKKQSYGLELVLAELKSLDGDGEDGKSKTVGKTMIKSFENVIRLALIDKERAARREAARIAKAAREEARERKRKLVKQGKKGKANK